MIVILELIALGVLLLVGVNIWNGMRRGPDPLEDRRPGARGPVIDGRAQDVGPGRRAAETLRDFENARAELKGRYPAVFAMLGGYLNAHTIGEHGGLEGAVAEMVRDWTPRREEVMRELTKLLAENDTEDEARAIVAAACDADFEAEGYRAWLTWLLGRFNTL